MSDLEHWPRLGDNLLGPEGPRRFHIDVAPGRGDRLAGGFKQAGDATLQAFVESRGRYRHLQPPALYCYRQFLELKLKYILSRLNLHYGNTYAAFLKTENLEALWRQGSRLNGPDHPHKVVSDIERWLDAFLDFATSGSGDLNEDATQLAVRIDREL